MKKLLVVTVSTLWFFIAGFASSSADDKTIYLANPGEWIHVKLQPLAGDERPVYVIWDSLLEANGFYQVAVPTKSGNRSVRHVAYHPTTGARLKYHILFDHDYAFRIQFEEFESEESQKVSLIVSDDLVQGTSLNYTPPIYCWKSSGSNEFKNLSATELEKSFKDNSCDPKAYLK